MSFSERDLLPLDPSREPARWEGMVGSIMAAASPELERRAVIRSPLLLLGDWFRPTFAATAAIAAAAAVAVLSVGELPSTDSEVRIVAEGIGIPSSVANWLDTGRPDALDELVFGFEGEIQ
jgi:hypothetical protein